MRNKRGQSILEYVIVLTVVVAAIALGANSFVRQAVEDGVNDAAGAVDDASNRLPGAR